MKILLIRPPYTRLKRVGQAPYFPLGLGYLASTLLQEGADVKIYHMENPGPHDHLIHTEADAGFNFRSQGLKLYKAAVNNEDHLIWQELREVLSEFQPDIVGVSVLSVEVASSLMIARLVKELNALCWVIWGGLHPTFMPEDVLKHDEVDLVVRGEGEYAMRDLYRSLSAGKDYTTIESLSWKKDGIIQNNPLRQPVHDIDSLPYPARNAVLYPERFDFKSLGSMILSRGCPFNCSFCSSRNFWDKRVRFRSGENVLGEIQEIHRVYGTNHIMFWDDSLTINKDVIHRYCDSFINSNVKFTWKASTRADLVDEKTLSLMRNSGCTKLEIGVESGSDRIKKMIRKDVDNTQIKRAFDLIRQSGISSGAFFMAGFVEETAEDLGQTFALMKELCATEMAFNIFDPQPGSSELDKCIAYGLIDPNTDWNSIRFWPDAHYVKNMSSEEFTNKANEIAKWLYVRNNSLKQKFLRNRHQAWFLLKNDPVFLLKKIIRYFFRRMHLLRVSSCLR